MKTLKESILSDIDISIDRMDKDLEVALNIPTKKDFEKSDYCSNVYGIKWYCPDVIDKYRNKYAFIKPDMDGIVITFRTSRGKGFNVNLMYKNRTWMQYCLSGWEITWYDLEEMKLPAMKKLALELITHLAYHPKAVEELFDHAKDYYTVNGMDFKWRDLRDLLKIK